VGELPFVCFASKEGQAVTLNQFEGCLLGLALGDALGAPHEGGLLERLVWRLVGTTRRGEMRWTDDTQMSLDIAESLAHKGKLDTDDLALRFARSYQWSRGYGPGAARLLKRIRRGADWRNANCSVYPNGSFGNGGAMRAPMIGLFYARQLGDLPEAARLSARITHAHPLGMEGAVLVASATALALSTDVATEIVQGAAARCALSPFTSRLEIAMNWLRSAVEPSAKDVARALGNGISASESCVTAVYIATRFIERPFESMLRFVADGGGDVDTIGAMSGAIWGAAKGASSLPKEPLEKIEQRTRLLNAAAALYRSRA
jgi:poly(ADP-ribose) glycohydrolase ARH3